MEFAKKYVTMGEKWNDGFSEMKKDFIWMDQMDFRYFWYDLCKEKSVFQNKFGGRFEMIWGAFAAGETMSMIFVQGSMNSEIM